MFVIVNNKKKIYIMIFKFMRLSRVNCWWLSLARLDPVGAINLIILQSNAKILSHFYSVPKCWNNCRRCWNVKMKEKKNKIVKTIMVSIYTVLAIQVKWSYASWNGSISFGDFMFYIEKKNTKKVIWRGLIIAKKKEKRKKPGLLCH